MTAGRTIGRYQLIRLLAAGGMGEVYLARQLSAVAGLAPLVAVKVLPSNYSSNPAFLAMFLDEARLVSRIRHRNVVSVQDVASDGDTYFIAMEYIPGQTLRELIRDAAIPDRPLFDPALGAELFASVADGLAAAHAVDIVHRDVTPNNVMIADDGVAKLIDFGVARAVSAASLTTPGTVKGKFGYMAPEYVRGQSYDQRADLFSLGVVMWETLARRRLFRGDSAAEQVYQLLNAPTPRLDEVIPGFAPEVADLVEAALQRDPASRIRTARELADRLGAAARSLPRGSEGTPARWLEARVGARISQRRAADRAALDVPVGQLQAPLPSTTPPGATSGSDSGSDSGARVLPGVGGRLPSGRITVERPAEPPEPLFGVVSQTSIALASGQAPGAAAARPHKMWVAIAALGFVVIVGVAMVWPRGGGARPAAAAMDLVSAHREVALAALANGDDARAVSELTESLRAGSDRDTLRLLQLATTLMKEPHATRVLVLGPSEREVFIDDAAVGPAPVLVPCTPGAHHIRLADGAEWTVDVPAGHTLRHAP